MIATKLASAMARRRWPPAVAAALLVIATGAFGQGHPPLPDRTETARLVWSTLIAIDHANKTGNYSVLRDLGAPDFRNANDPAQLASIFARFREPDIGLGRVVSYVPEYSRPPEIQENGMLRLRGLIPMRPEGVLFDMLFQHVEGEWRLFGVGIAPEEPKIIDDAGAPPAPKP